MSYLPTVRHRKPRVFPPFVCRAKWHYFDGEFCGSLLRVYSWVCTCVSSLEGANTGWGVDVLLLTDAPATELLTSHPNAPMTGRHGRCWLERLCFTRKEDTVYCRCDCSHRPPSICYAKPFTIGFLSILRFLMIHVQHMWLDQVRPSTSTCTYVSWRTT